MYHLAFFVAHTNSINQKIEPWLNPQQGKHTIVYVDEQQNRHKSQSFNYILLNFNNSFGHETNWYICSGELSQSSVDLLPELPVFSLKQYPLISLDTIDFTLEYFANNYQWTILPWGYGPRCCSFVFISREVELRDQFVNVSENTTDLNRFSTAITAFNNHHQQIIPSNNILISTYDVPKIFSEVAKVLLFDDDIYTVGETWDAFECDSNLPYLITDIFLDKDEDLFYTLSGDVDRDVQFTIINYYSSINLIDSSGVTFSMENIYVYQPYNKKAFESLCGLIYGLSTHLFIWLDGGTNLDNIEYLISQIYISYSDLNYLSNILELTEWFYGLRRDIFELFTSIIISRNNYTLREIDVFRSDSYRLLACF